MHTTMPLPSTLQEWNNTNSASSLQCIIIVHDDALSTTKCLEFPHDQGNINSGSYSEFHNQLYQLVACHLPRTVLDFQHPIQCIITVHDDALSTTKCIEFQYDPGNMNSGSYSAFHTELYQLVACHLPIIRIELYVVTLVFCHHPDTGGNFSEARVNSCKTESCSQSVSLSPTQFKTQARQRAIQKDVQNHRLVLHQSHSQV
jgi:hypothetical protein